MEKFEKRQPVLLRLLLVLVASFIFAFNINTFVHSASLVPGGFAGVALLVQKSFRNFLGISLPYSALTYALNAVPIAIGFRFIGRKFTVLSCVLIVVSGLAADFLPYITLTDDKILCAVFGGLLNALAVSLCLFAESSSGGTDFIAIYIAEKTGKSAWNIILSFNCVVLCIAGILFGWDAALYSIIFQYTSTQAIDLLYKKYAKTTLLIITSKPDEVYRVIREQTNHDATLFRGTGLYSGKERTLLYSVVSSSESGHLEREIRQTDPDAFINVLQSKAIIGKFFKRSND
ncbi:MAG: YitT family protein [Treponema sp.]|nr:YitT family protein [Treponema sp.]